MLTIVLPLYQRPQHAEQVLQALFSEPLDFGPTVTRDCVEVIISIDGGGIVPRMEYETHGTHVQVVIHQGQHFGMNRHIAWLFQAALARTYSRYVLLLEEDTVPCNGWRKMLNIGIKSGHNALALHPDLEHMEDSGVFNDLLYEDYYRSMRTSSWGLLLVRPIVKELIASIASETRTWDFALNKVLDSIDRERCYCASIPHTRHIGISGSDFTPETHPTAILNKAYEAAKKIHDKVCTTNQR